MEEFDDMKMRDAVMRDPEFSLRILWIRQALIAIFFAVGFVMTCLLAVNTISGDGYAIHILFPACWTVLVAMLLRGGMAKIKDIREEAIAQQNIRQVSSESAPSAFPDEPSM